ncbi:MAG TPA: nitrite/sulfite reductase [Acidimicrobiales bacterium]|nr:nitrite/sulfite reductase [Acidimicrobiales bacterium]
MPTPNIPAAKRAGLPVDLARLAAEGDGWLTPEDRYALKTHGVCAQLQDGVFMVRVRVPGGVAPTQQVRGLARIAARHAEDWAHLSTRQNVELHWVRDTDVPGVIDALGRVGLSTRSSCGHTVRNVMCSEDAGVGLDEPFDCLPDTRLVSDALVARSAELNVTLPSRLNVALGGSPRCRHDALLNDAGLVSIVAGGVPGYEIWAGGSLGKSPSLAVLLTPFVPREHVLAAVEALVDVFVDHGSTEEPAKGRMKFVLERLGADAFRAAWQEAFAAALARAHDDGARPVLPVDVLGEADRRAILARVPPGGWSVGVRPQRTPGLASVTIDLPLGDTCSSELDLCCDLADRHADGHLTFTRDQNITFRNVPLAAVAEIRAALAVRGVSLLGEGRTAQIRACTGSSVCALGITDAPGAGHGLAANDALRRNSSLRAHVSGCLNSCAQHQAGDIGLAGSKVRVGGRTTDGYQVYLGSDLTEHEVGVVVGRVATADLDAAVTAIVGTWEALRHPGEALGRTVRRFGTEAFADQIAAALADRWASGPEPATSDTPVLLTH